MSRRSVVATLLAILAAQLAGGIVFATVCAEACPDDGPGGTCPPSCALCTGCTHAQAIVQPSVTAAALAAAPHDFAARPVPPRPERAADIFHVPLAG